MSTSALAEDGDAQTGSSGGQEQGPLDPHLTDAATIDGENHRHGGASKPRVPVACTMCRSQHLRCDAVMPTCSRCRAGNKRCIYTTLRRRRRKQLSSVELSSGDSAPSMPPEVDEAQEPFYMSGEASYASQPIISPDSSNLATSRPLDGFYTYFHQGHPFVPPRPRLISHFDRDPHSIADLISIMTFIGSLYIHDSRSKRYRQQAELALARQLPHNGFSVQFLLLFALTLEWTGEMERASTALEHAKSIALTIGIHRQSFAAERGQGDPALEESWRRTWWELYIVDALFAGIRHLPTFSLWNVDHDADLPSEEECYITANIPPPRTLREYDNRGFEEGDVAFSSFTYLIDAARILGSTLAAGDILGKSPSSLVKNAEANIMSWDLHLPRSKRDPVRADGSVDEIMFRAHMAINTVSTHLHRPRSMLHYSAMELLCSKYAPPLPAEVLPPEEQHHERHTFKAIRSAKACVDLFTISAQPTTHSPFIMCMGSMATATHMSACEYLLAGPEYAHARDGVRVFLGILKAFEHIWPQASKWSGEIKLMAKAVFEGRDAGGNLLLGDSLRPVAAVAETAFSDMRVEGLEMPRVNDDMNGVLDMEGMGDLQGAFSQDNAGFT
ncbi:hypothetical protein TOPH_03594 [Tolypocladium ophioglossoides CBS 100239]|uniref:Zn(2)-C6 fungal-type domain-containing protein n=1 Tax=Tolypocladium ophioglossoides (strain CBS 100239) TaxID=1163406 RepID=A0A0L0NCT7_TOLOC|nr:hypothetical protein TOPH_03594 [Tolypocladium ophioglossoides CBS 100239]